MATTTNYSWTTPDDTALVKDGAAAIRSLGTAIDTTVFNNASAAIAKTIVDAKGDIIAATAADTLSRLAVGANGTYLSADSSTATGLKWSAISASPTSASSFISDVNTSNSTSFTGLSTAQSVTLTTGTKVMVIMTAKCQQQNENGIRSWMGYAISGATTVAASESKSSLWSNKNEPATSVYDSRSSIFFETVTAGSNTFTMQVKVSSGTSYFQDRQLLVIDLGS